MEDQGSDIWPRKHNVLGVGISATTYDELLEVGIDAAKARRAACVSHLAVHGLVTASDDRELWDILNEFEVVAPDGIGVYLYGSYPNVVKKRIPGTQY
jgi:UDP-N-acetyl-D-mannosaminuronic acid transferase (WecB/TagA/CpsF family)